MSEIKVLPKQVAEMIAAGEVVERPASAAKELIENAIDAGAHEVTVELRNGGVTYLRVTDDGCGIPADQVPTAFLRHATSKISTERDLEAIGTLGFRGEALAALAAVSNIQMLTKTRDADVGAQITMEAGEILSLEEAGCPDGTTVIVRNLFFNLPARYKFLKRDFTEAAAVHAVVRREALGHPEVAFRYIEDGKQALTTPGDDNMESALYAVLGADFAQDTVFVRGSTDEAAVTGFVSLPTACRGSRSHQFFFLNGRWIKSALITSALERAYQNQKMVGKFPGGVLYLATKLSAVDVNSHPTKTEVKFVREQGVFHAVNYAVRQALGEELDRPVLHVTPEGFLVTPPRPKPKTGYGSIMGCPTFDPVEKNTITFDSPAPAAPVLTVPPIPEDLGDLPEDLSAQPPAVSAPAEDLPPQPPEGPSERPEGDLSPAPEEPPLEAQERDAPPDAPRQTTIAPSPDPTEKPWRLVGEVMNTYVIVEQGETVLFIDKHAAHERMNFDALKAQDYRAMSQELLAPLVFRPDPEEGAQLLAHRALLEDFGFHVDDFGGGRLAVDRVPDFLTPEEAPQALSELAQALLTAGSPDPGSQRDALMHTMACKAAIKGGQKNDPQELLRVAQAVMSGAVRHCPHGRPVAAQLTRAQLERQFRRS